MAKGSALSASQVKSAIDYNKARLSTLLPAVRTAMGLFSIGGMDEAFVRAVADWQEAHIGHGEGDGKVGPKTEAYLCIPHPKALLAVAKARAILSKGGILFDDWGSDLRDNNNDGHVDDAKERQASDGAHFGRTYSSFRVVAGTYSGLGWKYNRSLTVPASQTVLGSFQYMVCADVVSKAYAEAGVMKAVRSTALILQAFRSKGYVWRRSTGYPAKYVPGDFICTLGHGGGHSGIVVDYAPTSTVPKVIELPGPSTQVDLGTYNPASKNDVRQGNWTKSGVTDPTVNYLGRLLVSKLH